MISKIIKDNKLVYLIPLLLFFAFIYKFFLTQGTWNFFEYFQGEYYNWLAKGFLEHSLGVAHAINLRFPLGFGDSVFFEGKNYLYFGPFPAAIHAILVVVNGKIFYGSELTFLASVVNLVVFWLILVKLSKIYFKKVNLFLAIPIFISYASGPLLFNIGRGFIYEEAIAISSTLVLMAFLFLLHFLTDPNSNKKFIILSSTFFGLAFLTRINVIMYFPLLFLLLFLGLKQRKIIPKHIIVFLIPLSLLLFVQMSYNFARFHNPLETGVRYQVFGTDYETKRVKEFPFLSLNYIEPNIQNYFFAPIYLNPSGKLINSIAPNTIGNFPKLVNVDNTGSIFLLSPILFSIILLPILLFFKKNSAITRLCLIITIGTVFFTTFGILIFSGNSIRYIQDFLPFLIILAFFSLLLLFERLTKYLKIGLIIIVFLISFYSFLLMSSKTCHTWMGNPIWKGNSRECIQFYRPIDQFHFLN